MDINGQIRVLEKYQEGVMKIEDAADRAWADYKKYSEDDPEYDASVLLDRWYDKMFLTIKMKAAQRIAKTNILRAYGMDENTIVAEKIPEDLMFLLRPSPTERASS